ncbi:unnamed protein product [Coccothraustes coccothraustes]
MPVLCAFVLHVSAAAALHGSRRQRNGFFVSDWKGTVPDEFEGCAENASVVRLRSSRLSSGRVLRPSEAKKRLLRALSIVPVSDWKGTVPDEFEGCAENASVVRLRSSRLSSGRVLRPSEAKKRLLRALSIVPVSDWKGTVPDEFGGFAENASVVRLRSSRLSSGRVLRPSEAKKRLLRALSIVPVAVLCKGQLLPTAARDHRLAPHSSRLASSVCLSACIFAESFSTLSHKEKFCEYRKFGPNTSLAFCRAFHIWVLKSKLKVSDWKGTVPDEFEGCAENASVVRLRSSRLSSGRVLRPSEAKKRLLRALSIVPVSDWKGTVPDEFESCAENARVVRLRSSRLSSGRALRLPEAKELLLYALSIVPLAVLSKARLLPKAARDRRLAPDSSRLASSVCLSACIFAESFSPLSHKEKLCLH